MNAPLPRYEIDDTGLSVAELTALVRAMPQSEQQARSCELRAQLLLDKSLEANTWRDQYAMQDEAKAWLEQAGKYRRREIV